MKAMVVEDSRLAREGLINMLESFPAIEVVASAEHPDAAFALLQNNSIDVLFLDIHMPGKSGFELLENLDYSPFIIFTTAYAEHAIRSFDYKTVDYLLKPISKERLAQAIEKLEKHVNIERDAAEEDNDAASTALADTLDINSRMFIKDGDQCFLVELNSIRYFESCKNYVRLYFDDNKAFIKKSLNNLEGRLPPRHFFRANRQYIVNLKAVKDIQEWVNDGYRLTLIDGTEIEVSRRHAQRLKELMSF